MVKTEHIMVLSHTTHPKSQHFATTTLNFGLAKCSVTISFVCSHPSGPRHLALAQQDRATESWNQNLRHVTHIWDQSLRAQQYIILRRSHGQVTKVPGQAPHITLLLLLLLKKVSIARLGESDIHHISPKTPAPRIPTYRQKEEKGKESRRL